MGSSGNEEWQAGTVRQLMWRDEDMEQGQVCPYKVRPLLRRLVVVGHRRMTLIDIGTQSVHLL